MRKNCIPSCWIGKFVPKEVWKTHSNWLAEPAPNLLWPFSANLNTLLLPSFIRSFRPLRTPSERRDGKPFGPWAGYQLCSSYHPKKRDHKDGWEPRQMSISGLFGYKSPFDHILSIVELKLAHMGKPQAKCPAALLGSSLEEGINVYVPKWHLSTNLSLSLLSLYLSLSTIFSHLSSLSLLSLSLSLSLTLGKPELGVLVSILTSSRIQSSVLGAIYVIAIITFTQFSYRQEWQPHSDSLKSSQCNLKSDFGWVNWTIVFYDVMWCDRDTLLFKS